MLDEPIVDFALERFTKGPSGLRLPPEGQVALSERLLAAPDLVGATRALYMLGLRLQKLGHSQAAMEVVTATKVAHERLPEALEAAATRHQRMLQTFDRVCDRPTTWRAPVFGKSSAPQRGGFRIGSMPRPKLR